MTAQSLIDTNFGGEHDFKAIDILEKLVLQTSYYMLDEPALRDLYSMVKANLVGTLEARTDLSTLPLCQYQICLYMSMAQFFEREDTPENITLFQINLVNYLLESQETVSEDFVPILQQLAI